MYANTKITFEPYFCCKCSGNYVKLWLCDIWGMTKLSQHTNTEMQICGSKWGVFKIGVNTYAPKYWIMFLNIWNDGENYNHWNTEYCLLLSSVDRYQCFREMCSIHIQSKRVTSFSALKIGTIVLEKPPS
jgi:hypothetical protein